MIVIPIYRRDIHLIENAKRLKEAFHDEMVVVSIAPSSEFREEYRDGLAIVNVREAGVGRQVKEGIRAFWNGEEPVVWVDGDLPVGLEGVSTVFELLKKGYDVVWCSRYMEGSKLERPREWAFLSRGLMKLYRFVFRWPFTDVHCGCFGFNPEALAVILEKSMEDGWGFHKEVALISHRVGFKVREFPVSYRERKKRMPFSYFFHRGVLLHLFLTARSLYRLWRGYYD